MKGKILIIVGILAFLALSPAFCWAFLQSPGEGAGEAQAMQSSQLAPLKQEEAITLEATPTTASELSEPEAISTAQDDTLTKLKTQLQKLENSLTSCKAELAAANDALVYSSEEYDLLKKDYDDVCAQLAAVETERDDYFKQASTLAADVDALEKTNGKKFQAFAAGSAIYDNGSWGAGLDIGFGFNGVFLLGGVEYMLTPLNWPPDMSDIRLKAGIGFTF